MCVVSNPCVSTQINFGLNSYVGQTAMEVHRKPFCRLVCYCVGVNYHEGAEFVRSSLARDQDVVVDFTALQQVLVHGPANPSSLNQGLSQDLLRICAMCLEMHAVC